MKTSENQRFIYEFGKFILDPQEKTLFAEGQPIHLPSKEFETLLLLVENNGRALSKEEMLQAVWHDTFVEENNLAKYISRLRKIFNTNDQKYIETLSKHGYRFSAEVNQIFQPATETIFEKRTIKRLIVRVENEIEETPAALPQRKKSFLTTLRLIAACLIILLLVAAGVWFLRSPVKSEKINSIAVLPLKPLTMEENNKALGLGLADALITKIGSLRTISVRPTSAVAKFAETGADALEIGRKLNADAVLEGTIQQSEGRIRINARLLKTTDGEQLWAENFDQPASEIFALQDALSNKITKTLAFELNKSEFTQLSSRPTENADAFEKYLRGRFYQSQNTEQGLLRSIENYEEAIALDPAFAESYAGVADAEMLLYNFGYRSPDQAVPKIRENIGRAMQLNPNISQAYLTAAQLAFLYEKDNNKAEESYKKAIQLDPNNADAFLRYGYFLASFGRLDDALVKLEKVRELNPVSSFAQVDIGLVYLCQKNYPAAIEQLNKTAAENPEIPLTHWLLGAIYEATGDTEKAFAENMLALKLQNESELAGRIQSIKQTSGVQAAYQKWYDEMVTAKKRIFIPALYLSFLAAVLKNREETLDWLEKAESEQDAALWQIKYVARYDFVRDDERFARLVQKMDFKQK